MSRVWDRLQDPATWALVAGVDGPSDHTFAGPDLTGFRFTTTIAGVPYRGTARVTETTSGEGITLSIRSNELHGQIVVALGEDGTGTQLDVTMVMRPVGLLGPIVFPIVSRAVEEGFPESVERLAAEMV